MVNRGRREYIIYMDTNDKNGMNRNHGSAAYRERIQQLEREIGVNTAVIEDEFRNVGEIIFQKRPRTISDEQILAQYNEAARQQEKTEKVRKQIERIKAVGAQFVETERKISANEAEQKKLVQQNIPHYEQIGQAAFEYYSENPFSDQEHADIFSELVRNQHDLTDIEHSIKTMESEMEGKPLFDRVVSRGRLALLKTRRQAKLSSLPRMYRNAGEKLSSTEFTAIVEDETLASVAGPFIETMQRIETLKAAMEKLLQEKEKLENELSTLCDGKRPQRRISDFENGLKSDYESLSATYRGIGRAYRELVKKEGDPIPQVAEYLSSISDTEKEISTRRAAIEKLNAAIELERIAREIESSQKTIRMIEDQIRRQQEEITSLTEKVAAAEIEKRKLTRARGPKEKLLER